MSKKTVNNYNLLTDGNLDWEAIYARTKDVFTKSVSTHGIFKAAQADLLHDVYLKIHTNLSKVGNKATLTNGSVNNAILRYTHYSISDFKKENAQKEKLFLIHSRSYPERNMYFKKMKYNLLLNDEVPFTEGDILEEIQDLDLKYRIPILLKYVDGYKNPEIADMLGINVPKVANNINYGFKIVKKSLSEKNKDKYV